MHTGHIQAAESQWWVAQIDDENLGVIYHLNRLRGDEKGTEGKTDEKWMGLWENKEEIIKFMIMFVCTGMSGLSVSFGMIKLGESG